jgi:hypothetical protein
MMCTTCEGSPCTLDVYLALGQLGLHVDPVGPALLPDSVLTGVNLYEDETVDSAGLYDDIEAFAEETNLTAPSSAGLHTAARGARDLHVSEDFEIEACTGPDVSDTNRSSLSFGMTFMGAP